MVVAKQALLLSVIRASIHKCLPRGGDYVQRHFKVLKTLRRLQKGLELNYEVTYPQLASKETFQVEVIGEVEPVEVTNYMAQISFQLELKHIFEQIKQDLERRHLLDLPSGIALIEVGMLF